MLPFRNRTPWARKGTNFLCQLWRGCLEQEMQNNFQLPGCPAGKRVMINDQCQPWKFGSKRDSMIRSTCLNCLEAQCRASTFCQLHSYGLEKKELKKNSLINTISLPGAKGVSENEWGAVQELRKNVIDGIQCRPALPVRHAKLSATLEDDRLGSTTPRRDCGMVLLLCQSHCWNQCHQ